MTTLTYYLVAGSESSLPVDLGDVQTAFVQKLSSILPDNPVRWVSLGEVHSGLSAQVACATERLGDDVFVVSLSGLYYPHADAEISCNRLVDAFGSPLGMGPRPRSASLSDQVANVMRQAADRPLIVVDDTLFHGDTVKGLIRSGLKVDGVVEFFTSSEAFGEFEHDGIPVFSSETLEGYLDVLPLHDFLPMMPLCGKVVGKPSAGGWDPLADHGVSYSLPYLLPFITRDQLSSWASIPVDSALEFSIFALTRGIQVAERLRNYGFSSVGSATRYYPHRTSVPLLDGVNFEPDLPLVDLLGRSLHRLIS